MASSLCLHSCASVVPRAAKHALSSLLLLHKFHSSLQPNYFISRAFAFDSASASASIAATKELRRSDLVALEYADLNLTDKISQELGHVRIRQHVNPLSSSFSVPVAVPDWSKVFRDPTLPLMVDIGSGILNCRHFIFANAAVSFKQLVSTYPGPLDASFNIDPHFKKRHHKRRVVQKPSVDSILTSLMPEGKVFIQSDVLKVAVDMRKQFDSESGALQHIDTVDPSD
ncbi:hypothetical protein REPUB_Repub16aG0075600 [Reevesia pubescens]